MIAVPFIYFSSIAIWQFFRNRKRIDIGVLIASIYAVSGFFSILAQEYNLLYYNYKVSFMATIVYCLLLTINLYPFIKYSHIGISNFKPLNNPKPLKILAWVAIIWFVVCIIFSFNHLLRVITGDMNEMRAAIYAGHGETSWMIRLPWYLRNVITPLNLIFGTPWILIILAFFSKYVQKLPIKYFIFFFIAALNGPISGIISVDRSAVSYWILSLLGIYLLFLPLIPSKHKKYLNSFLIIVIFSLIAYLGAMTISRFGDRDMGRISGTYGGIIEYLGQAYPNFCYFFDEFTPAFSNLNLIFPFLAQYVFGEEIVGGVNLQQAMDLKTGVKTGVFYTYLGQIRIFCGMFMMFLYCFVYSIFSNMTLQRIKNTYFSLFSIYSYFGLASIMLLGLFGYYYSSPLRTFSVIFILLFTKNILQKV